MTFKCDPCFYTSFPRRIENQNRCVQSDVHHYCAFPGCNYRTNVEGNWKIHQRQHETKTEVHRPFPCESHKCEYRASHEYLLQLHVSNKHTPGRSRNFKCPICPAKFYTAASLKAHIPGHTQEKSFKCSTCTFRTHGRSFLLNLVKFVHEKVNKRRWCHVKGCNYSATIPGCDFRRRRNSEVEKYKKLHKSSEHKFKCLHCPPVLSGHVLLALSSVFGSRVQ